MGCGGNLMEKQNLIKWLNEQLEIVKEEMELAEQDTNSDYDFYEGVHNAYEEVLKKLEEN